MVTIITDIPKITVTDDEYKGYLNDSRKTLERNEDIERSQDVQKEIKKEVKEFVSDKNEKNAPARKNETPDILRSLSRLSYKNVRSKPLYSDCWILGSPSELEVIERYEMSSADVVIGNAFDGQTEYNLIPKEYRFDDVTNNIITDTISKVRKTFLTGNDEPTKQNILNRARTFVIAKTDHFENLCSGHPGEINSLIDDLVETVYRHTMGLGIFDVLLSDPRLEDIYIDAPCEKNRIHVTLNGISGFNSHVRCRTNLIVDKREIQNLISTLKRDSGLPFCESSPVLETDVKDHDSRATVVGYPMSPRGDAVAIRKHSTRPWTLTRLVANGTIDAQTAGLLSFLVEMRSTFLISGARGAGKSSLLSALMFEFPLSQRILTIEDTMELPCETMRKIGYKVQSMLIDDRMNVDALKRSDDALRVSLRLGESAIILGEVRGDEARTLYQSMRTGKAGSSIMGTIHGDSAKSVYERVVHDMQIAPEAFMATDIIVTIGTKKNRGDTRQVRRLSEIVSTSDRPGEFVDLVNENELTEEMFKTPVIRRIMASSSMTHDDIISDIKIRAEIRSFLAKMSNEVGEQFSGPEWITMANDFVSKKFRSGCTSEDNIANEFKQWFGRYNGFN